MASNATFVFSSTLYRLRCLAIDFLLVVLLSIQLFYLIHLSRKLGPVYYNSSSSRSQDREFKQFVRSVNASLDTLRQGMQVLSLGIEYPRYIKFRILTPFVTKMTGDTE